ncbi:MAG: HNH endonuclease [archaeon]
MATKAKKECPVCGKEFEGVNKYCSGKCRGIGHSQNIRGKNNPYYKDGKSKLKLRLKNCRKARKWREWIRERDNHRCQDCGSIENLEVHHIVTVPQIMEKEQIKTWEDGMNSELFWDVDNGVLLCKECHQKRHKNNEN